MFYQSSCDGVVKGPYDHGRRHICRHDHGMATVNVSITVADRYKFTVEMTVLLVPVRVAAALSELCLQLQLQLQSWFRLLSQLITLRQYLQSQLRLRVCKSRRPSS